MGPGTWILSPLVYSTAVNPTEAKTLKKVIVRGNVQLILWVPSSALDVNRKRSSSVNKLFRGNSGWQIQSAEHLWCSNIAPLRSRVPGVCHRLSELLTPDKMDPHSPAVYITLLSFYQHVTAGITIHQTIRCTFIPLAYVHPKTP